MRNPSFHAKKHRPLREIPSPCRNDDAFLLDFLLFERLNQHAIAERFHIDCHMFFILLNQDPDAVSDDALPISMLSTYSNTFYSNTFAAFGRLGSRESIA